MNVTSPHSHQSPFRYSVNLLGSAPVPAWLTYSLTAGNGIDRSLLVTDDTGLVPAHLKSAFRDFKAMLPQRNIEKVLRAKHLANQIYDRPQDYPLLDVAVHKFGPVPVFVLPKPLQILTHKGELPVQIAIYPFKKEKSQIPHYKHPDLPITCCGAYDFRQSMRVRPEVIFQRYFEEAAEDMTDIARQLSTAHALGRGKHIESTMGASVRSKLDVLIPKDQSGISNSRDVETQRQWETFTELAPTLYDAKYSRTFVLYLLNRYYALIGLKSLCPEYLGKLLQIPAEFSGKLGEKRVDDLEQASGIFLVLRRYMALLEDPSASMSRSSLQANAQELLTVAGRSRNAWTRQLGEFSAFLLQAQSFRNENRRANFFISWPADHAYAENVARQIEERLKFKQAEAIFLEGHPAQTNASHASKIRVGIWSADAAMAIVPDTSTVPQSSSADHQWLGIEVDHSLRLSKPVSYAVEHGTDLNAVVSDLGKAAPLYLTSDWRPPGLNERVRRVTRHFQGNGRFALPSAASASPDSAPNLQDWVDTAVNDAVEKRVQGILCGMLRQFSAHHRRLLLESLSIMWPRGWMRVGAIAEELVNRYPERHLRYPENPLRYHERQLNRKLVKGAFQKMWESAKKRAIFLEREGDKEVNISLLRLVKRRYFTSLPALVNVYLPYMNRQSSRRWLIQVLQKEYQTVNQDTRFADLELRFNE